MTLHAFIQYLKYRWNASGRHGTHSPFVYAFVNDVLLDKRKIEIKMPIDFPGIADRYALLVNKVISYYDLKKLKTFESEDSEAKDAFDVLVLPAGEPDLWQKGGAKYFPDLKNENMVFVLGPHKTVQHTTAWNNLRNQPKVRMSIDLYGVGLLFFKKEFKERQHFVLKY